LLVTSPRVLPFGCAPMTTPVAKRPARLFISYSNADAAHRERFVTALAPLRREGLVDPWHDRRIEPGQEWAGEIDRHLAEADIVALLVSADFVNSDYCYEK